jgi:hypothetical protein
VSSIFNTAGQRVIIDSIDRLQRHRLQAVTQKTEQYLITIYTTFMMKGCYLIAVTDH